MFGKVSLQDFVTFGEAIAYQVILWRQDPQVCSGSMRAEKRWTIRVALLRQVNTGSDN